MRMEEGEENGRGEGREVLHCISPGHVASLISVLFGPLCSILFRSSEIGMLCPWCWVKRDLPFTQECSDPP